MCDSIITSVCAAHPAAAHLMLWGKVQRDTSGHRSPTLYIYAREARGDRLAGGVPPAMGAGLGVRTPLSNYAR